MKCPWINKYLSKPQSILSMATTCDPIHDRDNKSKRSVKCPGCKTPIDEHHYGIPSNFVKASISAPEERG